MYTLGQALNATKKSKSTILLAIKNGRISAKKDDSGSWSIEPSELSRVFDLTVRSNTKSNDPEHPPNTPDSSETIELKASLRAAQRERDMLQSTIDDLRADRDAWREQASHLKMLVAPSKAEKPTPKGIWSRLFGK